MYFFQSAVKIDVSDVSPSVDSKVLVLSRDTLVRDVSASLLRKLKMRDVDASLFTVEAEINLQNGELLTSHCVHVTT